MTLDALVSEFLRLTSLCLDQLRRQYGGTERPTVYTGLWLQPRDGTDPVRSGVLDSLGSFALHGIGCRFELDTGENLEVDWRLEDGKAVFDSWRILVFAQSVGIESIGREELRQAAACSPEVDQLAHDVFTWRHDKYDMVPK